MSLSVRSIGISIPQNRSKIVFGAEGPSKQVKLVKPRLKEKLPNFARFNIVDFNYWHGSENYYPRESLLDMAQWAHDSEAALAKGKIMKKLVVDLTQKAEKLGPKGIIMLSAMKQILPKVWKHGEDFGKCCKKLVRF